MTSRLERRGTVTSWILDVTVAARTPRWRRALLLIALAALAWGALEWVDRAEPQSVLGTRSISRAVKRRIVLGDGVHGPEGMVWIPGGEFSMGSNHMLAQPNERPAHRVKVTGFWMDHHHVTNAEFRRFVDATGYVTTAEKKPDWEALKTQLPPGTPAPPDSALLAGAMVFVGTDRPVPLDDWSRWWRYVPGASWKHPLGPKSDIAGKDDHPVVQVSYFDALAYAAFMHRRLPTEAEWEFAARGGLEQATYVWGNDLEPGGRSMLNFWDEKAGRFPVVRPHMSHGTSPACAFPTNGYGLCDMSGNAWQWVADWYRADYFAAQAVRTRIVDPTGPLDSYDPDDVSTRPDAPKRVIRGGSFLCNPDYCASYRPSARRGNDPSNPMSHVGFRLAMSDDAVRDSKNGK